MAAAFITLHNVGYTNWGGGDVVSPVSSRDVDHCPKGTQPFGSSVTVDPVSPPWQHAASSFSTDSK